MGVLLRLLVVSLLAVGTSKVNATHVLSMPVEPHFPTGGLSKPHKLPENLNYPLWFSMAPLYLPQQNPDINGPTYPIGAPVPRAQPPMLPVEPKYPIGGPVQLPQFPGRHPCSTGTCRLPMFPVEPKYPIGGPVPQVQPPMLPVEPKYPQGGPVPQVQPPMLPVEPKYPQGGPVPQVQPPMLPVEPKYPMGPVQLPQFPGRHPCSTGLCRLPMFPVEPKYPIGGPVPQVQPPMLPVEPKYPQGGPVPQVQPPMLPVEPKYLQGGPVPQVQPPMLPVEPKYPMGPVQLPQFPGRHPCSTGLCRLPMFPVEPKYPIGGPVPQVQPPMLPAEPKCLQGGPVPQVQPPMLPVEPKYPMGSVQLPQFPGRHPCSTGLCRLPMFPVEPKYPIGGPVPQVQPPMLLSFMFNFEPGKDLNDQLHHGYPPRSPGCDSKWQFFPSKPCS